MGHGSGYIVDESGLVITNAHVVKITKHEGLKKITVFFPADGDKKKVSRRTGFMDILPTRDLCLRAFQTRGKESQALKLCEKPPSQGETVYTFGSPLGFRQHASPLDMVTCVRTGKEVAHLMDWAARRCSTKRHGLCSGRHLDSTRRGHVARQQRRAAG